MVRSGKSVALMKENEALLKEFNAFNDACPALLFSNT